MKLLFINKKESYICPQCGNILDAFNERLGNACKRCSFDFKKQYK
jgi:DNA-directed RNA polymerase subunit RPC12/RpoP